jgi:hypothetical protein
MFSSKISGDQPSFWERQFAPQRTACQNAFDLSFGLALPLICLYFDPIVFRASVGEPLLAGYFTVAGVAISLGFLSLSAWMLLRRPSALLAGLLAGGAIFAGLLGLTLLPFSLIGLAMFIGVLGFTPFLTAFVFWRNAVRAYRRARQSSTEVLALVLAALGFSFSCGGPWVAHWYVARETALAMDMVQSPDTAEAARGLSILRRFRSFNNFDPLIVAYGMEKNAERRERLAASYKELTGEDIEHRLAILRD